MGNARFHSGCNPNPMKHHPCLVRSLLRYPSPDPDLPLETRIRFLRYGMLNNSPNETLTKRDGLHLINTIQFRFQIHFIPAGLDQCVYIMYGYHPGEVLLPMIQYTGGTRRGLELEDRLQNTSSAVLLANSGTVE